MYIFATVVLFALGILALVRGIDRFIPALSEYRVVLMVLLGLGGAWLADYNLFARFAGPVREEWIGIVLTGLVLGGLAHTWHVLLGWFEGLSRKTNDEADALERTQGLKAA